MQPHFEIFDHTADMGIRVVASSLPELIAAAAGGLYSLIGELTLKPEMKHESIRFESGDESDAAYLLRDFLDKLLFEFECHDRVASFYFVQEFTSKRLLVDIGWKLVDPDRSIYHREVKAITYHELAIKEIPGGYEATVIVDI